MLFYVIFILCFNQKTFLIQIYIIFFLFTFYAKIAKTPREGMKRCSIERRRINEHIFLRVKYHNKIKLN